jgi:hypothetical protein
LKIDYLVAAYNSVSYKRAFVGSMFRAVSFVLSLTVMASGCAKKLEPRPVSQAAFLRVEYQNLTCKQLAEEGDLLNDARAVENEDKADSDKTESVANVERAQEAVRQELVLKGCKY